MMFGDFYKCGLKHLSDSFFSLNQNSYSAIFFPSLGSIGFLKQGTAFYNCSSNGGLSENNLSSLHI